MPVRSSGLDSSWSPSRRSRGEGRDPLGRLGIGASGGLVEMLARSARSRPVYGKEKDRGQYGGSVVRRGFGRTLNGGEEGELGKSPAHGS